MSFSGGKVIYICPYAKDTTVIPEAASKALNPYSSRRLPLPSGDQLRRSADKQPQWYTRNSTLPSPSPALGVQGLPVTYDVRTTRVW